MVDEADTFINNSDDLRGIINCGHRRSQAYVLRCDGDNNDPRYFSTWAPMVIAMIKKPKDTILDRSIIIEMKRKKTEEKIKRFSYRKAMPELRELSRKIARWCNDHFDSLCDADPYIPEDLHDRAADNWRPLLSIAYLIDSECSKQAQLAALKLNNEEDAEDSMSITAKLLSDIELIFDNSEDSRLSSANLLHSLNNIEDSPWAGWNRGREFTPHQLARNLKPFGIKSKKIRFEHGPLQGYERSQFEDAFTRYLSGTPEHSNNNNKLKEKTCGTKTDHVPNRNTHKPLKNNNCSDVPDNIVELSDYELYHDKDGNYVFDD